MKLTKPNKQMAESKKEVKIKEAREYWPGQYLLQKGSYSELIKIEKVDKDGKFRVSHPDDPERGLSPYTAEELTDRFNILDKPIEEYEAELVKEISTGFSSFKTDEGDVKSTDLVVSGGRDKALEAQKNLNALTVKMEILTSIMERKKSELSQIRRGFEEQLKHINKIVGIIELYLGVHESIIQFKEGVSASVDEPICFRQLVLHMDEEVADYRNGGYDFSDIDQFEKWLLVPKNLQQVLPENKGVVVLRPRRNDKDYGTDDPFFNASMKEANRKTFILIRNGENLFHIFSDSINIYPHLFPAKDELVIKENDWRSDKEKIAQKELGYQRNVLMLQGLMDRTDVFRPIPQGLNLFKTETYGEHVKFIYDAGGLTDGRPTYHEWLKDINSKLKRGDRIFLSSYPSSDYTRGRGQDYDRFPIQGWTHHPDRGVYNLLKEEQRKVGYSSTEKTAFTCHYKDKEEVYKRGGKFRRATTTERKKSTPFLVYRNDDFIINYELITVEDIDYYMNHRIEKKHYMGMMPVLQGIRARLIEEMKMEAEFVKMMESVAIREFSMKLSQNDINESIKWWKNKVIEKRPLTKDDAKAARMIIAHLKRKNK